MQTLLKTSAVTPLASALANDDVLYYEFPNQTANPLTMPIIGDTRFEIRRRLPLIEMGLIQSGAVATISGPESLYAASLLLAIQYLRTLPVNRSSDPACLAVRHSLLTSTQIAICACTDDVWAPTERWPHSKAAMLSAVLVNLEPATAPAMRELALAMQCETNLQEAA